MTEMCIAAANELINLTNEYNKRITWKSFFKNEKKIDMTCERLIVLLYFSDIEYMTHNYGISMFDDKYHANKNGPYISGIYITYFWNKKGKVKPVPLNYGGKKRSELTESMKKAIKIVFERTKSIETNRLVENSHGEGTPCRTVYDNYDKDKEKNTPFIIKNDLYNYYKDKDWLQPNPAA